MSSAPDSEAGRAARSAVRLELVRAAGALLLAPFRIALYLLQRPGRQKELRALLARPAEVDAVPELIAPKQELNIFVSCAEPSGELHAINLVRALRRALEELGAPPPRFLGLGSERLEREGVELIADPVSRAAMGSDVLKALPFYTELLASVRARVHESPPDVAVFVDSPALHVPLARLVGSAGVPIAHFATPQYWGWAPWRVGGYRKAIDLALTILPFEPAWFRARGVALAHVGHPLLDELTDTTPTTSEPDHLVLLPGSRESVVHRNLPWMLSILGELRRTVPDLTVRLPVARDELRETVESIIEEARASDWVELEADLHGALSTARAAFSVSGTILIDLLMRDVPAVVIYRLARPSAARLAPLALTVPWFSSVNLLAARETFPEFTFAGDGPGEAVRAALERALTDENWRSEAKEGMHNARKALGPPGATERAALHVLRLAQAEETIARAE